MEYLVNESTSLVMAEPLSIVYLSPNSVIDPDNYIRIRDYTGNASINSSIVVSTTQNATFVDGTSSYIINEPYGYITVNTRDSNTWSLVNTFKNLDLTAFSVDNISTKREIVSTLYATNISTKQVFTSSIGGIKGRPTFAMDISGVVNALDVLKNGSEFKLEGDVPSVNTSSFNIEENGLGGSPSTNLLIGTTKIYSYIPDTPLNYATNEVIIGSNWINVNSTVNISYTGQVGINTSSYTSSLVDISGRLTTTKLGFPYFVTTTPNINQGFNLNTVIYAFNKWIITYNAGNYGYNEPVFTSSDGVTWQSNAAWGNPFVPYQDWLPVFNGINTLVYWGPGQLTQTTSDGSNFFTDNTQNQWRVTYGSNRFFGFTGGGIPNFPNYSLNGSNWIPTGTENYNLFYDYSYGPHGYSTTTSLVAIGNDIVDQLGIFLSYDNGSNWLGRYPGPGIFNNYADGPSKLRYNGSYWILLTFNAFVGLRYTATSPDLINWTESTQGLDGNCFNIFWAAELDSWFITFVANYTNSYFKSSDGLNWTQYSIPNLNQINCIAYNNNNKFMAVGNGPFANYQMSDDGMNWYTPVNTETFSTVMEASLPFQSSILINTSTVAKVSDLETISQKSTASTVTVTDAIYIGDGVTKGHLNANIISINNFSPTNSLEVVDTARITNKVITDTNTITLQYPITSSIAVNKPFAEFPLDISGSLHGLQGYMMSSLGVNVSSPSTMVQINGITNTTGFFINGIDQLNFTPSSINASTVFVNGNFASCNYNLDAFNNFNHSFTVYANNTIVTGTYFNNIYRSIDSNTFQIVLSNSYPNSFEAGCYNPAINRWGFLRRVDTIGEWTSYTTQDFVSYLSSSVITNRNAFNNYQLVYGSNFFWMIGDNGNSNTSLYRSADGINWTNIISPFQNIYSLVYTGSDFLLSGYDGNIDRFVTYRTNFITYTNLVPLSNIRVLSLNVNGTNYMGTGFIFPDYIPNAYSNVEFSSTDSVNWQSNLLPNIFNREYGNFNSPTIWTGTYWARIYFDLTNELTYAQSNAGTTVSTWSAPVQTPITQGQRVRNNFAYDGAKFWVMGGVGGGNQYTAYATNLFNPTSYISSFIDPTKRIDFPSTIFYNSTFFQGQTFTPSMNISSLQGQSNNPINIESFVTTNEQPPTTSVIPNIWVAVGRDTVRAIKYSLNGQTWINATVSTGLNEGWAVVYNGKQWLTCLNTIGGGSTTFFSSSNGISWTQNTTTGIYANVYVHDLIWTGSRFVAVGFDNRAATFSNYTISLSPDGSNWTPCTSGGFGGASGQGRGIAFNGYRMVAVGTASTSNQSIKYSDDIGLNWISISSNGFFGGGLGVATNGYMFVACGQGNTSNESIKYSFNGINWSNIPTNGFNTNQGWGAAWNGYMWVACGNDSGGNSLKYSYDGINWSNGTGGTVGIALRASWNGSYWVAVTTDSSSNARIKYSFNGINWSNSTTSAFNQEAFGVAFSSNVFPNLQADTLSVFGKSLFNTVQSTNSIHLQTSSLIFNNSFIVNQPQLTLQTLTNPTLDIIGPTRIQTLLAQSTVGIRRNNPQAVLDIQLPSTSGIFSNFPVYRGNGNDSNTSTLLASVNTWAALPGLPQSNLNTFAFYYRGGLSGNSNYKVAPTGTAFFTGQHVNLSVDSRITPQSLPKSIGLIVSSADQGYYSILPDGTVLTDSNAIWITETLPKIKLADTDNDPSVWGILTHHKNEMYNSDGTRTLDYETSFSQELQGRVRINGLGEGAIWVTNINGNLENGDYICSSVIPGFGKRQADDKLHNYTVGKATMSCDFNLDQVHYYCEEFTWNNKIYRKAFIGCSYHCS